MAQPTLIKKAVQTPNGTVAAHDTLTSVTVAPDGLHVYALGAHAGARIIVVFARDPLNGALTQQQVVTSGSGSANIGSPGGGFERLAVSPDGKTLVVTGDDYGLGGTASLGIDAAGALSVQSLFDHPYGQTTQIAFSGDGRNVYVANYGNGLIETFGRNTATGALFQEGNLQVDAQGPLSGVAVSPDGLEVYSVTGSDIASDPNANSLSVFSRNTATGSLTLINTMPGVGGDLVTLSPDGKTVYSSNKNRGYGSSTVTVFNRDTSTGALTVTQTLTNVQAGNNAEFSHIDDLIVSPDGQTVYVGSNGYDAVAFQRDTSSGLLTHVAGQDQFGGGFGLAASPDGTSLYTVNVRDNTITTYSTKNSLPAPATPAAPSILQENQAGYANTGALTIFGAAEHGATVTVYDGTLSLGTATADSATGVYSFTLNHALTDGPHSINVTASNSNGASAASTSTSVTVDTVPPTITLGTETSNNATTTLAKFGDVITETFTVAPSAYGQSVTVDSVTIDGQAATVLHGIGNSYTASHTVNAGDTNGLAGINVTAHDAAGNSASQAGNGTVTVDTILAVPVPPTPQHANTIVNLGGYTNIVTAPAIEPRATGKSGAPIEGGPFGGVTIPGTPDSETITAHGQSNTIAANGGNDTINAGFGTAHVTVSDADGNNIVTGSFGGSSVTLGDGDNIVTLGGYGNYIKVGDGHNTVDAGYGSETIEIAGGSAIVKAQGFYDVFNIDGGTTEITGFAGYATINLGAHFTGANSVDLRGFAGDIFTFAHGVGTITKPDGELVATINAPTGQTLSAIDDGTDGLKIVLGTIAPPPPPPSPVLVVLTETQWGVDITLAQDTKTVHLAGYDNKVTGGDGNHTIDGDNGGLVLTLGSGDNVISVNGYHDTIKLGVDAQGTYTGTGTGNNIVTGTLGSTTIHTGAGNQTINAAGFYNDITTGAGTSDITAGAGYSHVNTGNGHNTITAAGNENTVTTHDGDSTVTLTGWTNLIQAGAGHTQVSGGYFNTYKVTELGTHGGVEVLDFSTQFGDVLNLQDVIGTGSLRLNDSANGQDLLVSIVHGTTATQVADLHGLAGKSVLDLMASHSLVI